jgi:GTPase
VVLLIPNAPTDALVTSPWLKDWHTDILRLATAGSVDDGKSTLIGRLLYDSKAIYENQLAGGA